MNIFLASFCDRLLQGTKAQLCNAVLSVAGQIGGWLVGIVGTVAVFVLIIGGVRYIVAAGDEAQIKEAKNTIKYAIIGIIITMIAAAIVLTINIALNAK